MNWISENSELINVLSNVGMLVVWIAYLQVFLAGYQRQKKATILINPGGGDGLDAHCLVTNMSAQAIYIDTLIATLKGPSGTIACPITEPDEAEQWQEPSDLRLWTRQGPLESGKVRDMGTMQSILDHIRSECTSADAAQAASHADELELQVIAVYGSEDIMVAARRRFKIVLGPLGRELRPFTPSTEQIRSLRERRHIVRVLGKQQTEVPQP